MATLGTEAPSSIGDRLVPLTPSVVDFKVGLFSSHSRLGRAVQGVGSYALPGDTTSLRHPIRSGIYQGLTPGGSEGPRLGRRIGGGRMFSRCPSGFEFGGRFAGRNFGNCGRRVFETPGEGINSGIAGSVARATEGAIRSTLPSAPRGTVRDITLGKPTSRSIQIARNANIPEVGAKNNARRDAAVSAAVNAVVGNRDSRSLLVRRDGITLSPTLSIGELGKLKANKDMENGVFVTHLSDPGSMGKDEIPALLSTGLDQVVFGFPGGSHLKVSKTRDLTPTESRRLKGVFSRAHASQDAMNYDSGIQAVVDASNGGIKYNGRFPGVTRPYERIAIENAQGQRRIVSRWVFEIFLSVKAPQRAGRSAWTVAETGGVPDQKEKSGFVAQDHKFATKQALFEFKTTAFLSDKEFSSYAFQVKRVAAVWDPDLPPEGGYRCPEGTRYGGRITDRFGRNCGWNISRRLANRLEQIGRGIGETLDDRRDRRMGRRLRRGQRAMGRAERRVDRAQGRLDRAQERLNNLRGGPEGNVPSPVNRRLMRRLTPEQRARRREERRQRRAERLRRFGERIDYGAGNERDRRIRERGRRARGEQGRRGRIGDDERARRREERAARREERRQRRADRLRRFGQRVDYGAGDERDRQIRARGDRGRRDRRGDRARRLRDFADRIDRGAGRERDREIRNRRRNRDEGRERRRADRREMRQARADERLERRARRRAARQARREDRRRRRAERMQRFGQRVDYGAGDERDRQIRRRGRNAAGETAVTRRQPPARRRREGVTPPRPGGPQDRRPGGRRREGIDEDIDFVNPGRPENWSDAEIDRRIRLIEDQLSTGRDRNGIPLTSERRQALESSLNYLRSMQEERRRGRPDLLPLRPGGPQDRPSVRPSPDGRPSVQPERTPNKPNPRPLPSRPNNENDDNPVREFLDNPPQDEFEADQYMRELDDFIDAYGDEISTEDMDRLKAERRRIDQEFFEGNYDNQRAESRSDDLEELRQRLEQERNGYRSEDLSDALDDAYENMGQAQDDEEHQIWRDHIAMLHDMEDEAADAQEADRDASRQERLAELRIELQERRNEIDSIEELEEEYANARQGILNAVNREEADVWEDHIQALAAMLPEIERRDEVGINAAERAVELNRLRDELSVLREDIANGDADLDTAIEEARAMVVDAEEDEEEQNIRNYHLLLLEEERDRRRGMGRPADQQPPRPSVERPTGRVRTPTAAPRSEGPRSLGIDERQRVDDAATAEMDEMWLPEQWDRVLNDISPSENAAAVARIDAQLQAAIAEIEELDDEGARSNDSRLVKLRALRRILATEKRRLVAAEALNRLVSAQSPEFIAQLDQVLTESAARIKGELNSPEVINDIDRLRALHRMLTEERGLNPRLLGDEYFDEILDPNDLDFRPLDQRGGDALALAKGIQNETIKALINKRIRELEGQRVGRIQRREIEPQLGVDDPFDSDDPNLENGRVVHAARVAAAREKHRKFLASYLNKRHGETAEPWRLDSPDSENISKEELARLQRIVVNAGWNQTPESEAARRRINDWVRAAYQHETVDVKGGKRMRILIPDNAISIERDKINFAADIQGYDEAANRWVTVGSSSRAIDPVAGSIYNGSQFIRDVQWKNSGWQTIYNPHAYLWARHAGFETVSVSAADEGPYVWGRMGFRDSSPNMGRQLHDGFKIMLDDYRAGRPSLIKSQDDADAIAYLLEEARRANFVTANSPGHADYIRAITIETDEDAAALKRHILNHRNGLRFRHGSFPLQDDTLFVANPRVGSITEPEPPAPKVGRALVKANANLPLNQEKRLLADVGPDGLARLNDGNARAAELGIDTQAKANEHVRRNGAEAIMDLPAHMVLEAIRANSSAVDQDPNSIFRAAADLQNGGAMGDTQIFIVRGPDGRATGRGYVLKASLRDPLDTAYEIAGFNAMMELGIMPEGAIWDGSDPRNQNKIFAVIPFATNAISPDAAVTELGVPGRNGANYNGEEVARYGLQGMMQALMNFHGNFLLAVDDRHNQNALTYEVNGQLLVVPIDFGWGGRGYNGTVGDESLDNYLDTHWTNRGAYDMHKRIRQHMQQLKDSMSDVEWQAARAQLLENWEEIDKRAQKIVDRGRDAYIAAHMVGFSTQVSAARRESMERSLGHQFDVLQQNLEVSKREFTSFIDGMADRNYRVVRRRMRRPAIRPQ